MSTLNSNTRKEKNFKKLLEDFAEKNVPYLDNQNLFVSVVMENKKELFSILKKYTK